MSRVGLDDMENKPKKQVNLLFQSTENKEEEKTNYIRQTYFLTEELIEAIRILSYKTDTKKSVLVRQLLKEAIPNVVYEEACKNKK